MTTELIAVVKKGAVGMGATFGAVTAAQIQKLGETLQFATLVVGFVTGIAMFISICLTIRWKWRQEKRDSEEHQTRKKK